MFEFALNGRTYKFETAEDMAEEWDRKKAIKPRPRRKGKKARKAKAGKISVRQKES